MEESKNVSGVLERAAAAIMHDTLLEVVQTGCDVAPASMQVDGQASRPEEFEARWGGSNGVIVRLSITPSHLVFYPHSVATKNSNISPLIKLTLRQF